MADNSKQKRLKRTKKEPTIKEKINDVNKDIIDVADIIAELNDRVYNLELKLEEQTKFYNITTNTINYILATLYVYEMYFIEMGADQRLIKQEIEQTFYDAFQKNGDDKSPQYVDNIIKKINDQLRQFQEKINASG